MSDIIERLRQGAGHMPEDIVEAESVMEHAANDIMWLRAENKRLRALLGECRPHVANANHWDVALIARIDAALEGK